MNLVRFAADFAAFWRAFYETYDITTEIAVLLFVMATLMIVCFSRPENNYMYKHFLAGIHLSMVLIILHILLLCETIAMRMTHNPTLFNILYVIYSFGYAAILNEIFSYVNNLSYKRRFQFRQQFYMTTIFGLIWLSVLIVPMVTGQLLTYEDGIYTLTNASNAYVLCSFICSIFAFLSVISNRKDLSRVVLWGTALFIPIDAIAVVSQLLFKNAYFICATYALPYILFFLLFHANPYDFVTGCQGREAEKTFMDELIKKNKKFIHVSFTMPKLENRNVSDFEEIWTYAINYAARGIEKVSPKIHVFQLGPFEYHVVSEVKNEEEFKRIRDTLVGMAATPVVKGDRQFKTQMNIMVASDYSCITDANEFFAFLKLSRRNFEDKDMDQVIDITENDALRYRQGDNLVKNIMDIHSGMNLDDERVEVFIQPIYDLSTESFRTGESLMRMQIDGKRVFPDAFIPIAEELGCIHSLTRIMLYKVSKLTVEMSEKYDFDAITVNVSTMELTHPMAAEEFIEIIKSAGADLSKIRLEITESTTITDYRTILRNMKVLNAHGVKFYLDDFGTGYSNLERLASMPFSTIKFDKSILYRAMTDQKSEEFLVLLTGYFKKTGFLMVAEGIEDEEQKNFVEKAGIGYIQGYFYSRPLPALEAMSFFASK